MYIVYVHDANIGKENGETVQICANYVSISFNSYTDPVFQGWWDGSTTKKPSKISRFRGFLAANSCIAVGLPENKLL